MGADHVGGLRCPGDLYADSPEACCRKITGAYLAILIDGRGDEMPAVVPCCNRHAAVVADWTETWAVSDGTWVEVRAMDLVLEELGPDVFIPAAAVAA